jgi:glycosyltransferase involved in cell wall biosynthesis
MFEVSVIIPVYNAASFIERAVQSAASLPQVKEIILIEDGSKDNSYAICKELCANISKLKLYQHEGGSNRGPSASRNLGIARADSEFVAFLDADDRYLPERFAGEQGLFSNAEIDGVYHASSFEDGRLYTMNKVIAPGALFFELLKGQSGFFNTNSITLRKRAFNRVGTFNEKLILHQDTELWLRLAKYTNLIPGNLESAVSMVTIHENNRIRHRNYESQRRFLTTVICSIKPQDLSLEEKKLLLDKVARNDAMRLSRVKRQFFFYWRKLKHVFFLEDAYKDLFRKCQLEIING